jgi:hypothetical protein
VDADSRPVPEAYVFAEQSQGFRDVGSRPAPAVLERRGRHALELGPEMGLPWLSSIGHARSGLAAFWRGQWHDALWHFEESARLEVPGAADGHRGRLSSCTPTSGTARPRSS